MTRCGGMSTAAAVVVALTLLRPLGSCARPACPCPDASHCALPAWAAASKRREVFGFRTASGGASWEAYDWTRLTTLAWVQPEDAQAACYAHAHGARAVSKARGVNATWLATADDSELRRLADSLAEDAHDRWLDGVNFDMESPLSPEEKEDGAARDAYTKLVHHTAARSRALLGAAAQTSVDVAWAPSGVDGRYYDYVGLADAADLLFVMAYDAQSQNTQSRCLASANSPYELVRAGLEQWSAVLGGAPDRKAKLVLGLPWYGYRYACDWYAGPPGGDTSPPLCVLPSVPFRGASCSDAAGGEVGYAKLMATLRNASGAEVRRDPASRSPSFQTTDAATGVTQYWFDDAASLSVKVALADSMGLGGVGCWHLDALDYAGHPEDTRAMWQSFDKVTML